MGTKHNDWVNGDAHTPARDNYPWDSVNGYLHGVRVAGVSDGAGLEIIKFATVANAVNEITFTNAVTGASPIIAPSGSDTNIGLIFNKKGTGIFQFNGSAIFTGTVNSTTQHSKSFVISNPSATTFAVWRAPYDVTIKNISGVQVGGTNVVGMLTECDANGLNPVVCHNTDLTILTTNVSVVPTDNPTINAGDYVGFNITSVSGSVSKCIITFEYTID